VTAAINTRYKTIESYVEQSNGSNPTTYQIENSSYAVHRQSSINVTRHANATKPLDMVNTDGEPQMPSFPPQT